MKSICRFLLIVFIITLATSYISRAQYFSPKRMTRGADTAEIYLYFMWYMDQNYHPWHGMFRSVDNGQTLALQSKSYTHLGLIFADSISGTIYQVPMAWDTFGVSHDYGVTFEPRFHAGMSNSRGAAGCLAGELYMQAWCVPPGLYRGTSSGDTFTYQSDNINHHLEDVGTLPGELYFFKTIDHDSGNVEIDISTDYGLTYSTQMVHIPGVIEDIDIRRGTSAGEFYLLVWKTHYPDIIEIYHSTDYGHTVTLQSIFTECEECELYHTAGRIPGSYYITRWQQCGANACIYIYFSRDYGVTFTSYFHDLDSTYTGVSGKEKHCGVTAYPNPAGDHVTFRFSSGLQTNDAKITLYNVFGNPVAEGLMPKEVQEITLNTSSLAAGIYMYVFIHNQHRQYGKILITD